MAGRGAGHWRGGRGAFYKNKYGGRGVRGAFAPQPGSPVANESSQGTSKGPRTLGRVVGNYADLKETLSRMNGMSYPAYQELRGVWNMGSFLLSLDRIQGDLFDAPTKARIRVPQSTAQFPISLFSNRSRTIALTDYITRKFHKTISQNRFDVEEQRGKWSDPGGGAIRIDVPGQQVLQRNSVVVTTDFVESRVSITLPASGRKVLGNAALDIFMTSLPFVVQNALLFSAYDSHDLETFISSVEDQDCLRKSVLEQGYSCFVPNGAILPRESGASDKPLPSHKAVPFQSPPSLEKTFALPYRGNITGMAVPCGLTTIVGGGFHGKSTLLEAISLGVWNHIPGDGREFTVTDPTAVGVRSEDGRSVSTVDISPFVNNLPGGGRTQEWSSEDASGSTSMAANVVEACELGSRLLLFDEDRCAANFMVRDEVMKKLVPSEPVTPLIEKIRGLYNDQKLSSILVVGGKSDFLIADLVILMENYKPLDVTKKAHSLVSTPPFNQSFSHFPALPHRSIVPASIYNPANKRPKPRSLTIIQLAGNADLDLSALSQLVHQSQTRFITEAIVSLSETKEPTNVKDMVEAFIADSEEDILGKDPTKEGWLAAIRPIDLGMALNRIRGIKVMIKR